MFIQKDGYVRIVERNENFVKQIVGIDQDGQWSISIRSAHRAVFANADNLSCSKMPKSYTPPYYSTIRFFKEHLEKFQGVCNCIPMDDRRYRVYLRVLRHMGKDILHADQDLIQWVN